MIVNKTLLWKVCSHKTTYRFIMVKTGVRQGCRLFLFLLDIDWIMKKTTDNIINGFQWTPWSQLEDLDFADDLALLSHSINRLDPTTAAAGRPADSWNGRGRPLSGPCILKIPGD